MALWTTLPVKLLSLNVVAEMVAVTRMSCEDRAGETDLKAYCMNYVGNNYERDAPVRGVRVFTATAGGASGRSAKEFYMCFAPDADTSCLKSLLAVQRLKHDFEDPASKVRVAILRCGHVRPVGACSWAGPVAGVRGARVGSASPSSPSCCGRMATSGRSFARSRACVCSSPRGTNHRSVSHRICC